MPDTVLVLNGPNLNLLGLREPHIYGHDTLDDIAGRLEDRARELDLDIDLLERNIRTVNPTAALLRMSARTGDGLDAWYAWLDRALEG